MRVLYLKVVIYIGGGDWRVRLYKCMRKAAQSGRKAKQANDPKTALQETTDTGGKREVVAGGEGGANRRTICGDGRNGRA